MILKIRPPAKGKEGSDTCMMLKMVFPSTAKRRGTIAAIKTYRLTITLRKPESALAIFHRWRH